MDHRKLHGTTGKVRGQRLGGHCGVELQAHLAAVIVAGVHPSVAHAIRRPNDIGTFGWPDDLMITDDDRLNLVAADAATDKLSAGHYAGLSDEQRSAFVTGIDAMGDILL